MLNELCRFTGLINLNHKIVLLAAQAAPFAAQPPTCCIYNATAVTNTQPCYYSPSGCAVGDYDLWPQFSYVAQDFDVCQSIIQASDNTVCNTFINVCGQLHFKPTLSCFTSWMRMCTCDPGVAFEPWIHIWPWFAMSGAQPNQLPDTTTRRKTFFNFTLIQP